MLAGPEMSHPKPGVTDARQQLGDISRAMSCGAAMLAGGWGVLLGAMGVVERTLMGNDTTGSVSE